MSKYETKTEYDDYRNLLGRIRQNLEEGWMVLYVIETPQSNITYQPYQHNNSTNNYFSVGPDGTLKSSEYITAMAPLPTYEIVFIRRDWNNEPCPRCSYPFPNEDDIGRDS